MVDNWIIRDRVGGLSCSEERKKDAAASLECLFNNLLPNRWWAGRWWQCPLKTLSSITSVSFAYATGKGTRRVLENERVTFISDVFVNLDYLQKCDSVKHTTH